MKSNNGNIFYLSIQDNSQKKIVKKKNNGNKKVGNLNLKNPNNKITYISSQIYQGYSGDFRAGVRESSNKLSVTMLEDFKKLFENKEKIEDFTKSRRSFEKLLLKHINEQMKTYEKDIKSIIKQSIFSSTSENTQYFNNINNYNKYASLLEEAITNKMIKDIFDETLKILNESTNRKLN